MESQETFGTIIEQAHNVVVLQNKQIEWLVMRLRDIEMAISQDPFLVHYDWESASLMYAKKELQKENEQ